jgi:hypothetical protein
MKRALLPFLLFAATALHARTLEVSAGGTYTNLQPAAAVAQPGDTILFRAGTYPGGQFVSELQGTPSAWITVMAAPGEEVILSGGSNSWQLSDPEYLRIAGFTIEGQTGNGMNIDDAGTYETPAHHLIIERCTWRGIDATGNNDELKMSGIDSFEVRDCIFRDGSPGGSMIDMVGCHDGVFTRNTFERAGSNCIQAKGGCRAILIERNAFLEGGSRAINIGGSTGLQFFRPLGINYESADIRVFSNIFTGSDAPVAFVGTVNSQVVNNTIYLPKRWAIRILQETTEPGFLECGDNSFRNNIVIVNSLAASPTINIGPNTRPESFTFSNNLWYNIDNPGWAGPNVPVAESNSLVGRDPMLAAIPTDMTPRSGSPAIGAGVALSEPELDYLGRRFAAPPSIGAIEGGVATTSVGEEERLNGAIRIVRRPEQMHLAVRLASEDASEITLVDLRGDLLWHRVVSAHGAEETFDVPLHDLPNGLYLIVVRSGAALWSERVLLNR